MYPRNLLTSFIPQLIRSRLEELDRQTQAIDAHVTRLAGVTPVKEDEVCSFLYSTLMYVYTVHSCTTHDSSIPLPTPLPLLPPTSPYHLTPHCIYTLYMYVCVSPLLSFSSCQSLCAKFCMCMLVDTPSRCFVALISFSHKTDFIYNMWFSV